MSLPSIPRNFYSQQGNNRVHLQWDQSPGAVTYNVERSLDGISFSVLASVPDSAKPEYIDSTVTIGTQYFYRVCSVNVDGNSPYSPIQNIVPTQNGEMSLGELRTRAQQRADRLNSDFVSLTEWNSYINQSMTELYDILITVYEDYAVATPFKFQANGTQYRFPLPDGVIQYQDDNNVLFTPKSFYKLLGVDLGLNTSANAYVSVNKFNFLDRNRFVFPNTASTIYGVFNLQYRLVGDTLEFIPTPAAGQWLRVWYVPRLDVLLSDKDLTTIGISGWLEYVIVDAAIKALQKEESDTGVLEQRKLALIKRIEESASNRDAGQPDRISDIRFGGWGSGATGGGWGWSGPMGGI